MVAESRRVLAPRVSGVCRGSQLGLGAANTPTTTIVGSSEGVLMRSIHTSMLVAVMAIAALAMSASSASAVEVSEEDVGHCPAVTAPTHANPSGAGGCSLQISSNGQIERGTPAGMTLCDYHFEARIDEDGAGYVYSKALTSCNVPTVPCVESGGGAEAWPIVLGSAGLLELQECFVIAGSIVQRCHIEWDVDQVSHAQVDFATGTPTVHRACENLPGTSVQGSWTAEADQLHPEIEIAE